MSKLILAFLLLPAVGFAQTVNERSFKSVPSRFRTTDLSLSSRGLGEICLSRDVLPDGRHCNPAFLYQNRQSVISAKVFFGNGFTALSTANSFLNAPITKEFLQTLFEQENVTSLEAHLGLFFDTKHFSASFSPFRIQYFSEVHNPNLPIVSLHAAREQNLTFAAGGSYERFSFGAKLLYNHRKFIHGSFSFTEIVTQEPGQVLPTQNIHEVFIEPVVSYQFPLPHEGEITTSLQLRRLGHVSEKNPLYYQDPDLELGVGGKIRLGIGTLKAGVDVIDLVTGEDLASRIRFGASYEFGILTTMLGVNRNALTAGMHFKMKFLQAGIAYEFLRTDLIGREAENRIATEIGFVL